MFVGFVNNDSYGSNALASVFVEKERRRLASEGTAGGGGGSGGGSGGGGNAGLDGSQTAAAAGLPSSRRQSTGMSAAGSGGRLILSSSPPFLSVDRRASASAPSAESARVAAAGDLMASLRRLIGFWLFFHEMARSPSLTKVCFF